MGLFDKIQSLFGQQTAEVTDPTNCTKTGPNEHGGDHFECKMDPTAADGLRSDGVPLKFDDKGNVVNNPRRDTADIISSQTCSGDAGTLIGYIDMNQGTKSSEKKLIGAFQCGPS